MPETADSPEQTYEYKAEVQKLLDILVHSVYSSKDVFLRELISNSADALEKVRFAEVRGQEIVSSDHELRIDLEADEEGRTLTISDNGIGMTESEVRDNLGTIARSGATAFMEKLEAGDKDGVNLIGQFGIGFYSVFMVATRVVLTTRSATPGEKAVRWESDGLGSYTISEASEETPRGTKIEISLREEEDRFATTHTLEHAIRTHSNFVPFPVRVGGETKNKAKALWREQPSQVSDDDYREFYESLTFQSGDPRLKLHFQTDLPLQFSALLFVPTSNPEVMGFGQGEVSLQMYVKRVLIDSDNSDLLPKYLRFAKGVVESEDLPLNISRETLQENRVVAKIRETLTKQLLGEIEKLSEKKPDDYLEFWKTFGQFLKEGYTDFANRERIQKLLRFESSKSDTLTSLEQYVSRMSGDQEAIYFLSGASRSALERDPRLEIFRKKNIEVLYLVEPADEIVLAGLGDFDGKEVVSADQAKIDDLEKVNKESTASDEKSEKEAEAIHPLLDRFKAILGEKVVEVRASDRLVDSPACLVAPDGTSSHMEKLMRYMQQDSEEPVISLPNRILELNPKHSLVTTLNGLVAKESESDFLERACLQIFEGAMLADGHIADPHVLVERMLGLIEDAAKGR